MIVTIDGPAGAGKSSMAQQLAERLGFRFLDTGAMYRAIALAGLRAGVDWEDLIRSYQRKIWNIHLKDHLGRQSVPIGQGEIDLKGLIGVLHEIDYRGALAVELEPVDTENLPRYIAEAYRYLDDLVREVTGNPPLA